MKLDPRRENLLRHTFIDFQQTLAFIQNPLIIDRAEGLYYWDVEGKRYFDGLGGIFVAILGHRHPRVIEAVHKQLEKVTISLPMHSIADATLDFVERVGQVTPGDLNFVKSYSGGSESMESAMKFTRQYFKQTGRHGKYKFIARYGGYHGGTFGAMAASGTGPRKTPFEPHLTGFPKVFPPNHYRDRFATWEECNRFSAQSVEDVIVGEDPATVAGVIVEPVSNTGGVITPTDEYFRILREICDRHEVMLIYDEIITAWGKTGNMFAAQTFGVTPDIICGGKSLSSGVMPLGAMMASEEMGEAFLGPVEDQLFFAHGHTYAGNPLGCAVGMAVIDEIVDSDLTARAQRMGDYLATRLEGLKRLGVIREVRGKGLLRGVELVKDATTMEPYPELGQALKRTTVERGVIVRVDPTWFAVSPALVATEAEIDELCDLLEKSLVDALEAIGHS